MAQITKDSIQALLVRKDNVGMHAVGRALVVLYNNQTHSEQRDQATKLHNNTGFTPSDARRGTSMAEWYMRTGFLTPKQLGYWQDPARTPCKRIRITKYWSQLLEAAEAKQRVAQASLQLAA